MDPADAAPTRNICFSQEEIFALATLIGDVADGHGDAVRDAATAAWTLLGTRWSMARGVGRELDLATEAALWTRIAGRPRPWAPGPTATP